MTDEPDKLVPVRDRLDQVAALLQDAGNFVAELPLRDAVLAAEDSSLGSDHPDTLASRGNLANAYQAAGAPPGHPAPRTDPHDLRGGSSARPPRHPYQPQQPANAYQAAGRTDRGHPLHEQHPHRPRSDLGPDHPDTLPAATTSPAPTRPPADLTEAIPLHERTLTEPRADPRPRPPRHPRQPQQPRHRLPGSRPHRPRPSRSTSGPSPTRERSSAPTTPTL